MVYVPNTNRVGQPQTKIAPVSEPDIMVDVNISGPSTGASKPYNAHPQSSLSSSYTVIPFVLDLTGITNVDRVLATATTLGVSDDDLQILEATDVALLLPEASPLQQRKFLAVCEYLQAGGRLEADMTMSTVYNLRKNNNTPERNPHNNGRSDGQQHRVQAPLPTTTGAHATPVAVVESTPPAPSTASATPTAAAANSNTGGSGGTSSGSSSSGCNVTSLITGLIGGTISGAGSLLTYAQSTVGSVKKLHSQFMDLVETVKTCS